jgi:hypothetical protein
MPDPWLVEKENLGHVCKRWSFFIFSHFWGAFGFKSVHKVVIRPKISTGECLKTQNSTLVSYPLISWTKFSEKKLLSKVMETFITVKM